MYMAFSLETLILGGVGPHDVRRVFHTTR